MDYIDIESYIKEKEGYINIPEIQKAFQCTYKDAKRGVDEAVEKRFLIYKDGLNYEINPNIARNNGGHASRFFWNMPNADKVSRNNGEDEAISVEDKSKSLKKEIKEYIVQEGSITITQLQKNFNLKYGDAYKIIAELVEKKFIELEDGLNYNLVAQNVDRELSQDDEDRLIAERRAFLEQKRQEIIRRMREDLYEEDDENDKYDEEDDDEDDDEEGLDDDGDEISDVSDSYEKNYEEEIRHRRQALEQKRLELIERMRKHTKQPTVQEETGDVDEDMIEDTEEKVQKTIEETDMENASNNSSVSDDTPTLNSMQCNVSRLDKKEYEQSELCDMRQQLAIALHNIAVAQDDKLRNGGKSYSEEYFSAFNETISICEVGESKYELKADNVFFTNQQPYKIYLIYVGNRSYLSDEGQVYDLLSRRIGNSRAKRKLEKHTELKLWLRFEKGILLMPTSIEHSVGDFFSMYFAMRSLLETF